MWGVVANGEEHLPKTADFGPGMDCSFTESECESEFEGLVYAYDSRQKECKLKYLLVQIPPAVQPHPSARFKAKFYVGFAYFAFFCLRTSVVRLPEKSTTYTLITTLKSDYIHLQ